MATQKRHSEIDSDLKVIVAYLEQYPAIRDSRTEEYKNRDIKSVQSEKLASDCEVGLATVKLEYKTPPPPLPPHQTTSRQELFFVVDPW